jgi:hemoglobin/transferrin/lactoferrin receptor protein
MSRTFVVVFALCAASPVMAQAPDSTRNPASLDTVVVTATRSERSTFDAPQPVTVLDSRLFKQRLPNGIADLFRDFPGLDASGVGPNQRRPEIRGLRGQRILLLQDGLRLNNSRRQQDFGEIPAVAGTAMDRVEVVRGPSSVLYGSDAIGGVINIISPDALAQKPGVSGDLTYRYGSFGLNAPSGRIATRFGKLAVTAGATIRDAKSYRAPAGTFGDITLDERELVHDSGISDESYDLSSSLDLGRTSQIFARAGWYKASDAGFGFIEPSVLGPGQTRVQILYPDQSYSRQSLGFKSSAINSVFANRIEVTGYAQQNERTLENYILVPAGPGATIDIATFNFSDLATLGTRVELAKALGQSTIFTYGVDAFRDRSENTDSSRTIITGFGPPMTRRNNVPQIPNATFSSAGVFAQLEAQPVDRLSTIFGARYQAVSAKTRVTEGIDRDVIDGDDQTVVWSANGLYRATRNLNLVASVGRGFRAANLVERFFEGIAPEGNGYQKANPDLEAESSINTDLGLRFRAGRFHAQAFAFRNDISNAIRTRSTGDSVSGRPAFQNENIDRLRMKGLELSGGVALPSGFDMGVSFTKLDGTNVSDPDSPIGDSYSTKAVGDIGYRAPGGRFTAGYTLRYQGEQKDVIVGQNPIGDVIPSFVVHSARASALLFQVRGVTNELAVTVENIGNRLYAEFPNASFFRPEAERSVTAAMVIRF